jgi:hypothetical protein
LRPVSNEDLVELLAAILDFPYRCVLSRSAALPTDTFRHFGPSLRRSPVFRGEKPLAGFGGTGERHDAQRCRVDCVAALSKEADSRGLKWPECVTCFFQDEVCENAAHLRGGWMSSFPFTRGGLNGQNLLFGLDKRD